jgi:hypothetical protein
VALWSSPRFLPFVSKSAPAASSALVTKYVIVGSGPCGLGAAWRLDELARLGLPGASDFIVVEQQKEAGGLAASVVDDKGFTWDMGQRHNRECLCVLLCLCNQSHMSAGGCCGCVQPMPDHARTDLLVNGTACRLLDCRLAHLVVVRQADT